MFGGTTLQWNEIPSNTSIDRRRRLTTRRYTSEHRAELARRTKLRILRTAEHELRDVGYHAMTVASLARRAEVSPQTIYNAIGSKAAVVKGLYDVLLVGDDASVPLSRRPEFTAVLEQPDGATTVRAYVTLGRRLYERVGELLGIVLSDGPGGDAELKAFVDTIESERRTGNESVVRHIENAFGLPSECPPERAVDVLWALTSFELTDRLIRRCGWSLDAFEIWAADMVITSVWGPTPLQ